MIIYPNGFDPVETNGVYANNNGYDIIRPCSEVSIDSDEPINVEMLKARGFIVKEVTIKNEKVENEMPEPPS